MAQARWNKNAKSYMLGDRKFSSGLALLIDYGYLIARLQNADWIMIYNVAST